MVSESRKGDEIPTLWVVFLYHFSTKIQTHIQQPRLMHIYLTLGITNSKK